MKKCWPWAHHYQRDYTYEAEWQTQSLTDIRAYRCTKCQATKITPAGTDL